MTAKSAMTPVSFAIEYNRLSSDDDDDDDDDDDYDDDDNDDYDNYGGVDNNGDNYGDDVDSVPLLNARSTIFVLRYRLYWQL